MALFDLLSVILIRRTSCVVCIAHDISSRLDHVGLRLSRIFHFSSFLCVFVSRFFSSFFFFFSFSYCLSQPYYGTFFLHSHHWQYTGKDMWRRKRRETNREQCKEEKIEADVDSLLQSSYYINHFSSSFYVRLRRFRLSKNSTVDRKTNSGSWKEKIVQIWLEGVVWIRRRIYSPQCWSSFNLYSG